MKIALVGGSNCLIKDGFGQHLIHALKDHTVQNFSLGASSILRGLDCIQAPDFSIGDWDRVIIEYTVNDLIFEQTNTLNPIMHGQIIHQLQQISSVFGNIFVCVFPNKISLPKALNNKSRAYRRYQDLMAQSGVQGFDALPYFMGRIDSGFDTEDLFQDNDHLKPDIAKDIAQACAQGVITSNNSPRNQHAKYESVLVHSDHYTDCYGVEVKKTPYATSIAKSDIAVLHADGPLFLKSPGGILVGFYILTSVLQGVLRITTESRTVIKNLNDVATNKRGKGYYCLRHLSVPIRTRGGEQIKLELIDDLPDVMELYDFTQAEIPAAIPIIEQEIAFGPALFWKT